LFEKLELSAYDADSDVWLKTEYEDDGAFSAFAAYEAETTETPIGNTVDPVT
jgi:sulfur transfer protein SufE